MTEDAARPAGDPERIAQFRIVGRLGMGGMGVVYRAHDESLRRDVALKLLPEAGGDEERKQRFLREARSAAAISHPNVAVVHQVGEADGRVYIAMELVEGQNLRRWLDRERPSVPLALDIAGQIARGLAAAHLKGIVHRDLKPENVMITPSGAVKLLDFGLAKSAGESRGHLTPGLAHARTETLVTSDEGRIMGTPEYMSPEQATGEPLDLRSDVFSFGILLYEMLAGARPFTGLSTGAVLVRIARDPPAPLRSLAPDIDERIASIVERCLAKNPADRFPDAAAIESALAGSASPLAVTASAVHTEPPSPSRPATPATSRRWWLPAGLLAVLLGAGLLFSPARWRSTSAPASSSSASPAGVAITDHPPPRTGHPEAAAAYVAGLQLLRDASIMSALDEMERAATLDPGLAAAHTRLALYWQTAPDARDHLAAALPFRASLEERDAVLLHVAELALSQPADWAGAIAALRTATARFPRDAELAYQLGAALLSGGQRDDAVVALERAMQLDPAYGMAAWRLAMVRVGQGKTEEALQALARCVEMAPSSTSCLLGRAELNSIGGRCTELEADARRMTLVDPKLYRAWEFLGIALAANGAPVDSVRAALDKMVALGQVIPNNPGVVTSARETIQLAFLTGDFSTAVTAAHEQERTVAGDTTEGAHELAAMPLIEAYEEEGQPAKALETAEAFARLAPAWTPDVPWSVRNYLLYARHHAGRIGDDAFRAGRAALVAEASSLGVGRGGAFVFYGAYAETPDEVDDAVKYLTEQGDTDAVRDPVAAMQDGRVLLRAGRVDEAIVALRRAVATCFMITSFDGVRSTMIALMRAHRLLGQALETKQDAAGACEQYSVVMQRWKDARPRSVTLDAVRARARALQCGFMMGDAR